jgi:hypothetical protein
MARPPQKQPQEENRRFRTFGWQGITLTLPQNWRLHMTQGGYDSGYVRLADEETLRLEMRWETGPTDSPAGSTAETYLAKLRKKARKSGLELKVERDLPLAAPTDNVECYRWVADRQALAMVSRCSECNRTVHIHLLGEPDEGLRNLARTVFASLRDHPDGEWAQWAFHDLAFHSPVVLQPAHQGLQTGAVRMRFGGWLTRMEFVRASLAQVVLRRKSLEDWFADFYEKELKRRSWQTEPATVHGHPGLRLEGRPWLLVNPMRLLGRPRVLRGRCWHCQETNRIFICCYDGPQQFAHLLEPAVQKVDCCGTGEAGPPETAD